VFYLKQHRQQCAELITLLAVNHNSVPFLRLIGDYDALLKKVPDLKLQLAHAGFPLYSEPWNNIKNYKNVYVDLSQTSYPNDRMTRAVVDFLGVEKCLFGTDGPYGVHGDDDLFDYSFIKRRIERLFSDKEIQKRLLGENFLEFIEK